MQEFKRAYLEVTGMMGSEKGGGSGSGGAAGGAGAAANGDLTVGDRIEFQFNPKEYSLQMSANVPKETTPSGKGGAAQQYTGNNPRTLTVEAFFNAHEDEAGGGAQSQRPGPRKKAIDVSAEVEKLLKCCSATKASIDARKPTMPVVTLFWGQGLKFEAVVKSVSVKYTLFKPNGVPLRATCNVTLEEHVKSPKGQNPTSGGPAARRSHRVVDGDSLPSIAYEEYGDPGLWRAIAELNGIDDPMRLPSGSQLLVPEADEALVRR